MINTTTQSLDEKEIKEYLGIVTGEAISGSHFVADLMETFENFTGGISKSLC